MAPGSVRQRAGVRRRFLRGQTEGERIEILSGLDLGDRVVMRPLGEEPIGELEGKYRGKGVSTERARRQDRASEASRSGSR